MFNKRCAEVGDLIIENGYAGDPDRHWTGVVSEAKKSHGHQSVFISWTSDSTPPDYYPQYGYSFTNIHNCVSKFDVIKNKR